MIKKWVFVSGETLVRVSMQGFACEMDHVNLFGTPVFSLEAPLGKT